MVFIAKCEKVGNIKYSFIKFCTLKEKYIASIANTIL